jgi:hypothetical protein
VLGEPARRRKPDDAAADHDRVDHVDSRHDRRGQAVSFSEMEDTGNGHEIPRAGSS